MDEVLYELNGSVGVVTLNRPERLNALNADVHQGLKRTWTAVKADDRVKAVIVTGAGKGFCVGMDLKSTSSAGFRTHESTRVSEAQKMTALNNDVWLPTIVAINGVCAGGGLHFIADADIVLSSDRASFVDPHVSVGQVTALEPISLMSRIGLGNALALAVLGRSGRIDAATALRIGLVNEVVEHDLLMARALEVARLATQGSPASITASKRAVYAALERPMGEAMQLGYDILMTHRTHPDATEGPRAFAEKRTPEWVAAPSPAAEIWESFKVD